MLRDILGETLAGLEEEGVYLHDAVVSPITGRKGNREFLFHLKTTRALEAGRDILKALDF